MPKGAGLAEWPIALRPEPQYLWQALKLSKVCVRLSTCLIKADYKPKFRYQKKKKRQKKSENSSEKRAHGPAHVL